MSELDYLRQRVARLEELIEHKLAREPLGAPATRILPVKQSSGTTYKLQDWDGSNYVDAPLAAGVPTSEREITVENPGIARAIWSAAANRFEKLSAEANGWITFTTASALLASDASQDDCPVALVWEGADPGDTLTIYNELGFEADAGVDGYAKKCAADGKWKLVIIPCPAGAS